MAAICSCSNGIVLLIAIQERVLTAPKCTGQDGQLPASVDRLSLSAVHDMGCVNSSCSNPKREPPHPLPNTPIGTLIASSTSAIRSSTMQASLTLRPSATRVFAAKKDQVRSDGCAMENARHGAAAAPLGRGLTRARGAWLRCGSSRDRCSRPMVSHDCSYIAAAMPQRATAGMALPRRRRRRRRPASPPPGGCWLGACTLACPFSLSSRCITFTQVRAAAGMKVMAYKVTLQTPDGEQVCSALLRSKPTDSRCPAPLKPSDLRCLAPCLVPLILALQLGASLIQCATSIKHSQVVECDGDTYILDAAEDAGKLA